MNNRKEPYEVKVTVGLHGIAVTDIYDPSGIVEDHIVNSGLESWFDYWINSKIEGGLEAGRWHLKGKVSASEDDCNYSIEYQMPDLAT